MFKKYSHISFVLTLAISLFLFNNFNPQNSNEILNKNEGIQLYLKNSSRTILHDDLVDLNQALKKHSEPFSEKKKRVKGILEKGSPNLYAKWYNDIRTLPGKNIPDYAPNYQIKELLKYKDFINEQGLGKKNNANELNWRELGPGNVAGRTRAILVNPEDVDEWTVGSVGGGVWRTSDAGQTWTNLTKNLPNLATSTLGWAPYSDPNVIYVGTGEGFGNVDQIDGSGIWRTTNNGRSWVQMISTTTNPDFENVMRLAVHPTKWWIVVAAVAPGFNHLTNGPTSGIYRSDDGGLTWKKTFDAGNNNVEDLRANPENFNTLYATVNSTTVIKSNDGGLTWFEANNGIGPVGRMEITIAPSDTNRVYISAQGGATGSVLYSSTDGGANWFAHNDINGQDVHWLGGQGWYDNTIAVNPFDENQVFVGGIQLWQLDIETGIDTSDFQVTSTELENVSSFLWFVNWGGSYAGGGLDLGLNFHGLETSLTSDEYSSVEVRFGPGVSQMAHMFVFASGFQYPYVDYVEVPFEVWDIDNNKQLMVSFRDQDGNGEWNLSDRANAPGGVSREYVFIHAIDYDEAAADPNIAQTAGIAYKNTYAYWPEAPTGTTFDADNLPDALIRINWGTILTKGLSTTNIADAYTPGAASKGVHVDHHNIVLVKTSESSKKFRFINGNDGGIAFSDDKGATFSQTGDAGRVFDVGDEPNEILLGYNTTQFYGIDKANGIDRYVGGTQDNGSWVSPADPDETSFWVSAPSGDGYEASWHYNDLNKIIETSQFNGIYRSLDGGQSWSYIAGSIDNGSANAPFFTKIGKSKQDPDLIFAIGSSGVWRSDNFGSTWTLTPMPSGFNGTSSFSQVKISLKNPQIVWSARNMTASSPPYVSTDAGLSFSATTPYSGVTMGRISGFETHPTEDSTAFALAATKGTPKVLKTTDLGQTWTDLSGFELGDGTSVNGFPDVAVYSLLVMPYNTEIIWAGTEIGLFESTDGGANWAYADNGFPPAAVYDMVIVNDEIVIATHGRGVWAVAMPELDGYEPPQATLSPRFASLVGGAGGSLNANVILPSAYDSSFVYADNIKLTSFGSNETKVDSTLDLMIVVTELDTISISIKSYKDGKMFISSSNNVVVYPLLDAVDYYENNFDEQTNDFVTDGFEVATPDGFTNGAVHSSHPYQDGHNFTYILKAPIIVANENATIEYDDIALIEPGNQGSVFGDATFWDYVIVEGSNDNGVTWLPLADGYDAASEADWLNAYFGSTPGDETMYKSHSIDLHDTFSAGETILVRFRLFSDSNTNGWGWAIDNLKIQEEPVVSDVNDINALPTVFSLDQNYPNPFNPTTTIRFGIPNESNVVLKVYNTLGQEVTTLVNEALKPGYHLVNFNASNLASGVYLYRIEAGDFVEVKKLVLLK